MKLALIVLAHRAPRQLASLLTCVRDPSVNVYLHVDRRVRLDEFRSALGGAMDEVTLLPRHATRWGGIELVDASLDGLRRGYAEKCDYFVLISGQDFPLAPIEKTVAFFDAARDRSYLTYWDLPTPFWRYGGRDRTDFYTYTVFGRRETCIPRGEDTSTFNWKGRALNELLRLRSAGKPRRRFPSYVRPAAGWQWWNLSRAAAEYVLRFVSDHPDYRAYHRYTWCPDELFFHSILLGTSFAESHELCNDDLRFQVWPKGDAHPHVLTAGDLPAMRASGKPFARKFDSDVDDAVLRQLADRALARGVG